MNIMDKSLGQLEVTLPTRRQSSGTDQDSYDEFDWTPAEEKKLVRK